MADYVSKVNITPKQVEGDYITAFQSFEKTPAYAKMMENPIARQSFAKIMDGRKEQAIRNGRNPEEVNLFSKLAMAAKNYVAPAEDSISTERKGFVISA